MLCRLGRERFCRSFALLGSVKPFKQDSRLSSWHRVLQRVPGAFTQQGGAGENTEDRSKVTHLIRGPAHATRSSVPVKVAHASAQNRLN